MAEQELWLYSKTVRKGRVFERRKAEKIICLECGKSFLRPIGKKTKYCSIFCSKGQQLPILVGCNQCGKEFKVPPSRYNAKKKKVFYCSPECGQLKSRKHNEKICPNCGKKFRRKNTYCSQTCQHTYEYNQFISRWKQGLETGISGKGGTSQYIKKYVREKYGNKCTKCGWDKVNPFTGKVPLQLEHKDGHWDNNKEENLDLICPNCHSLTETYGGANKGKGRPYRYKLK
jgi:hypothetical protein